MYRRGEGMKIAKKYFLNKEKTISVHITSGNALVICESGRKVFLLDSERERLTKLLLNHKEIEE